MKEFFSFSFSNLLQKGLVIAILFIFTAASFAQEGEKKDIRYGGYARIYSMGDNPYVVDPDNIKTNAAYSGLYSNFVWGDIGSSATYLDNGYGQFLGVSYGLNKEVSLGLMLTRNDFGSVSIGGLDPTGLVALVNGITYSTAVVPLNNNTEILGSYKFGTYTFGLGFAFASSSREFTPATGQGTSGSASQIGVNLGLIGKPTSTFEFDFAFSLLLPSASYTDNADNTNNVKASSTFMMANARAIMGLSSKFAVVPTVDFYMGSGKVDVGTTSNDLASTMGFGVGLGLQYKTKDLLLVGGPSFMYRSSTQKSTTTTPEIKNSTFTLPAWHFGAEWNFNEWLIGRLGYLASTYSSKSQSPASQTTVNEYSQTGYEEGDFRLGIGFKFGGFNLDATVNDDVLRQGFRIVGGPYNTFAYLSASYGF